jgi:hypothetical protein
MRRRSALQSYCMFRHMNDLRDSIETYYLDFLICDLLQHLFFMIFKFSII